MADFTQCGVAQFAGRGLVRCLPELRAVLLLGSFEVWNRNC